MSLERFKVISSIICGDHSHLLLQHKSGSLRVEKVKTIEVQRWLRDNRSGDALNDVSTL